MKTYKTFQHMMDIFHRNTSILIKQIDCMVREKRGEALYHYIEKQKDLFIYHRCNPNAILINTDHMWSLVQYMSSIGLKPIYVHDLYVKISDEFAHPASPMPIRIEDHGDIKGLYLIR